MTFKRNETPTKIMWVDLEMTGLDPLSQHIIEVAVIVTDFDFKEVASYESVVHQPDENLANADDWVNQNFGGEDGLLNKVKAADKSITDVENELIALVEEHFDEAVILGGSSIHQDRRFMRKYWPNLDKKLHYRMLDVSSWKVLMQGKFNIIFHKPEEHVAMKDIRGSMDELKYYIDKLQQM